MANLVNENIYRVAIGCFGQKQLGLNVKHLRVATQTGGPYPEIDFANDLADFFDDDYAACLAAGYKFVGVSIQMVKQGVGPTDILEISIVNGVLYVKTAVALVVNPGDQIVIGGTVNPLLNGVYTLTSAAGQNLTANTLKKDVAQQEAGKCRIFITPSQPVYSTMAATAGTGTGGVLPTQTAGLMSLKTDTGGRTGRGRLYMPFPYKDASSDLGSADTPQSSYVDKLTTVAAHFLGQQTIYKGGVGPTSATFFFGLYDERNVQMPTFKPFTSVASKASWATQRRRGDQGKSNTNPWGNY